MLSYLTLLPVMGSDSAACVSIALCCPATASGAKL